MMRTLIVEDGILSRKFLHAVLAPLGPCDFAANGTEALAAFQVASHSSEPYQLVCLDLKLPGMDGHQVLKGIRLLEEMNGIKGLERTKVVMTTASKDPGDVRSAFRAECDGYVVKPIKAEQMMACLREAGCAV